MRLGSGGTQGGNLRSPHLALGSWTPLGLGCTGPTAVLLLISLVNKAAVLYVEVEGPSGREVQPYSTAGSLERHSGPLCFTSLLTTASSLPRSPSSCPP